MRISARNQLKGTIVKVVEGAVNGVVVISLGDEEVKADITRESIKELGLTEGKAAYAVIKATNVMYYQHFRSQPACRYYCQSNRRCRERSRLP